MNRLQGTASAAYHEVQRTDGRGPVAHGEKILVLISAKKLTLGGLAAELGASRATAARAVAALRRCGAQIICVRDGHGWHYDLKDRPGDRRRWETDPLAQLSGFASSRRHKTPGRSPRHDRILYPRNAEQ